MRLKSTTVQIVLLVIAAFAIAVIANAFGARERRLKLVAYYPNARVVPPRVTQPVLPTPMPVVPPATMTTTTSGGQAIPPVPAPVTTTVAPVKPEDRRDRLSPTPTPTPTPAPPPPSPAPAPDPGARFVPHPDKPYVEIGGDDVAALHKAGALFLDARRSSVYEEGHIAGARSFSVWESDVDEKVNALFNERSDPRDQNLPIVIYCSGGACEDSHMLAQKLWGVQFNNVYVYRDGYPDWQKRGGATRSGTNP